MITRRHGAETCTEDAIKRLSLESSQNVPKYSGFALKQ